MARALDGAIAERSLKLLGLLTTEALDDLGVSRQQRRTLVAHGVLVPVARGVLRHAAHPTSWHQTALATVLAAGAGAVISHASAAWHWRFERLPRPDRVEVTVPRGRHPRAVPGVVHTTLELGPADVDLGHVVPRTTPCRTLCDIASRLDRYQLETVLDHAERRGLIWRPQLRWRIGGLRASGRPGLPALDALLDRTDGRPHGDSWLEEEAIRLLAGAGLPLPRVQVKRRTRVGASVRTVARVDLFWDSAQLVVELAGHGSHATRRDRQRGAERAARIGLLGWRVIEFTYEDVVERPDHVAAMVRDYLDLAA